MKNAVAVLVAVARQLAQAGIRPRRDVVLAFTAHEEDTAAYGAAWLVAEHPGLFEGCTEAIGESGGFTFHAGNGIRLYPLASAERGTAWLRLTARGRAGHGSKPNPDNAVARLGGVVARIGAHRWPVRLIPAVSAAISAIASTVGARDWDGGTVSADPALAGNGAGHYDGGQVEALLARLGPASALIAAGHGLLRVHAAMAAAGFRLLRDVPRRR